MNKYTSVINRFLKGSIAGAVSSMSLVTLSQPKIWSDFGSVFNSLGIAFLFGAVTGMLMALQKWASWEE